MSDTDDFKARRWNIARTLFQVKLNMYWVTVKTKPSKNLIMPENSENGHCVKAYTMHSDFNRKSF